MISVDALVSRLPGPLREHAIRHKEILKFATVGGITFVIDNAVYYALAWTVLQPKPTSAKILAILVATIVSYVLNSEWSFSARGGHHKHNEAALFFLVSGVGIAVNAAPLYLSRHWLGLDPDHLPLAQVAFWDFVFGSIIGMLLAMVFRWWAFRKFVFPDVRTPTEVDAAPAGPAAADREH